MSNVTERIDSKTNWKKAAIVVFLIFFVLIITLYLVAEEFKHTAVQRNREYVIFFRQNNACQRNECCIVSYSPAEDKHYYSSCRLKCTNFNTSSYDISKAIERIVGLNCETPLIELEIEDIVFPDDTMVPGWISSSEFEIRTLTVNSVNLKRILPQSFSHNVFKNVSYLILQNLHLSHIEKGFFDGFKYLKNLFIYNSTFLHLDEDAATPITETLEIMQIHQSKLHLSNLTGKNKFISLYLADFRYNVLENVKNNSFSGMLTCQSIYLSQSHIATIEEGTFKSLNNLKLVSLENNHLGYLSKDVFDDIIITGAVRIALFGNPWICDCNLKWLQEYVYQIFLHDDSFVEPTCDEPDGVLFSDFCSDSVSSIISSSTTDGGLHVNSPRSSTALSKGTSEHEEMLNSTTIAPHSTTPSLLTTTTKSVLNCSDLLETMFNFRGLTDLYCLEDSVSVLLPATKFYAHIINSNALKIVIQVVKANSAILWYNTKQNYDPTINAHCQFNLNSSVYIDDLTPGNMYVFCLYDDVNNNNLSPFDCQEHKMALSKSDSVWFMNENKSMIIGLFCVCVLGVWLVGGLTVYTTMRINPSLLKGSKRVEIVKPRTNKKESKKSERNEGIHLPIENETRESIRRRVMVRRSSSETSIASYKSRISYISTSRYFPGKQREHRQGQLSLEPPQLPPRLYDRSLLIK